jgi:hypothetical protein
MRPQNNYHKFETDVTYLYTAESYGTPSVNIVPLYCIKAYGGVAVQLHSFVTSALDGVSDEHFPAAFSLTNALGT